MKKLIFFVLFALSITGNAFAQATIAKLNFEEAEEAYNKGEYEKTLAKLELAEKNFGKINPPILHLRIVAQHKLLATAPTFSLYGKLAKNCKTYMADYAEIEDLIDKTREVYKINDELSKYPTTEFDFNSYAESKIKDMEKQQKLLKYASVKNHVGDMIYVEGGTFEMGSNNGNKNEKPVRKITVNNFYIGKYEITKAQWKAIMGELPPYNRECDDCPVATVNYVLAQQFIEKLNATTGKKFRLPTEAEWEYAAKGGNQSKGYVYSGSNDINEVACYVKNVPAAGASATAKTGIATSANNPSNQIVGKLKSNELGIYDMSGNVMEWCSDWYGDYITAQTENPKGPATGKKRVVRGGSWASSEADCKVTKREERPVRAMLNVPQWFDMMYVGLRLVAE